MMAFLLQDILRRISHAVVKGKHSVVFEAAIFSSFKASHRAQLGLHVTFISVARKEGWKPQPRLPKTWAVTTAYANPVMPPRLPRSYPSSPASAYAAGEGLAQTTDTIGPRGEVGGSVL